MANAGDFGGQDKGEHREMKVSQMIPSIRIEVEQPLCYKLSRAWKLIHMFTRNKPCVSCSFGKDSMLVLWLVRQEKPDIPVVFTNTGVEFKETIEFKDRMVDEWGLNLIEVKPEKTFWKLWEGRELPDGSKHKKGVSVDRCCHVLKEKPFRSVVKQHGFTHNFTGITVAESRQRMLRICERGAYYYHKTFGVWNIHPIAFWTPEEVWAFTKYHRIPVNPVYEKYGMLRVGCLPCTAHRGWRKQLGKVNPKMLKHVLKNYFDQPQLEDFSLQLAVEGDK